MWTHPLNLTGDLLFLQEGFLDSPPSRAATLPPQGLCIWLTVKQSLTSTVRVHQTFSHLATWGFFVFFFFLATEILPHPLYHIRYPCNLKTRNLISGSFGTHSLLVFDPLLSTHLWISYCHCLGLNPIWRNYYLCDFEFGDWNSLGLDFHIYKMGIKIWAPECL